jgi:hypothetical protein
VRFRLDQALPGTVEEVLAALTDPAYLATIGTAAKVGEPEVLEQTRDGSSVRQLVRYRFTGELSSAVTAVVDRRRLVWVDEHVYDLERATATFRVLPEHYADRLRAGGTERFVAGAHDGETRREIEAELTVRWPVVGGMVERAIVSGLKEHLADEADRVSAWLRAAP